MDKKKAVALSYNPDEMAPKVVAKGQGVLAESILNLGRENDLVIYEDSQLVESLLNINLNEAIPPELYEVVAEIILYVYSLDKLKHGDSIG